MTDYECECPRCGQKIRSGPINSDKELSEWQDDCDNFLNNHNCHSEEEEDEEFDLRDVLSLDFLFYDNLSEESGMSKEKRAEILSESLFLEEKKEFIEDLMAQLSEIDGAEEFVFNEGIYSLHFERSKISAGFFHGRYLGVEDLATLQKIVSAIEQALVDFLEKK